MHTLLRGLAILIATTFGSVAITGAQSLPPLGIDPARITVSGLSSGAYMAGQFQIAHSDLIAGAGIIAGGPYACAHTPGSSVNPFWNAVIPWNLARAQQNCMEDGWLFSSVPDASSLLAYAKTLARRNEIADLSELRGDKVYLFSSRADQTVEYGVVEAAATFYRLADIAASDIHFEKHDRAAHAFLTEENGKECGQTGAPFLNDCDYDQAGAILKWLAGPLGPPGKRRMEAYMKFSQGLYTDELKKASLDKSGIAYIPQSCRNQTGCALHIIFHGCKQSMAAIGDDFIKKAGYARWAEGNHIALLFPQATASLLNPNGCWDWWGYTGRDFLTRKAPQIRAVKRMIDKLSKHP